MERTGRAAPGMRDVWIWALSWFLKPAASPEKRAQQAVLIQAIKAELEDLHAVAGLHDRYAADSRWCLLLARRLFPRAWPTLGTHACAAAAYGLRYVELMTGHELDARGPLPAWLSEWAVW